MLSHRELLVLKVSPLVWDTLEVLWLEWVSFVYLINDSITNKTITLRKYRSQGQQRRQKRKKHSSFTSSVCDTSPFSSGSSSAVGRAIRILQNENDTPQYRFRVFGMHCSTLDRLNHSNANHLGTHPFRLVNWKRSKQ